MDKINYYLYHIPGKKIGVTRDLISRVVEQQGYDLDEVEVLEQSTDINYISDRELELQLSYGYRVDRQKYKDLYINKIKSNKMYINATEQTSTFPVPVSKLKGRLMDDMGKSWLTSHGKFEINMDSIKWIMENVKTSMYTTERCYVYNKAFARWFDNNNPVTRTGGIMSDQKISQFDLIRLWANDRGLYDGGDPKTQALKLVEEVGETCRAILKEDAPEMIDGSYIGFVSSVEEYAIASQLNSVGDASIGSLSDIGNRTLLSGLIGQAAGITFFRSNNLPDAS